MMAAFTKSIGKRVNYHNSAGLLLNLQGRFWQQIHVKLFHYSCHKLMTYTVLTIIESTNFAICMIISEFPFGCKDKMDTSLVVT